MQNEIDHLKLQVGRLTNVLTSAVMTITEKEPASMDYFLLAHCASAEQESGIYSLLTSMENQVKNGGDVNAGVFEAELGVIMRAPEMGHMLAGELVRALDGEHSHPDVVKALRRTGWFDLGGASDEEAAQ